MTTDTTTTKAHWLALLGEANDALGAARTALAATLNPNKARPIYEEIEFWTDRKAFVTAALIAVKA